ncbi:MAG: SUMF1/EgtB/PvdO family nonheme iron enzyme [Verrucomicrobia bacterium]|nr:SUMF1/EgtB/PvdO family nonheme iron enzyme [Verrucomicrobiota bacterium]
MNSKSKTLWLLLATAAISQGAPPATVTVGKPGNAADSTGYGAVAYEYKIGKYEVTNEEYCKFLNGAAKTDSFELYDGRMAEQYGGIFRSGEAGSFTYSVKDGMGKKPVNFVTWLSCVRFANWLSNGGGSGDTETGAYTIKWGQVTPPNHATLAAGKTTKWVLASENEWYKAAYFDAEKPGGAGYWPYAAKGGSAPACNLSSDAPSEVGSFKTAPSPWGTFDQNGNMWEYNDSMSGDKVGLRGGSFYLNDKDAYLLSSTRYDVLGAKWPNYGFRVVALGSGKSEPAPAPKPADK